MSALAPTQAAFVAYLRDGRAAPLAALIDPGTDQRLAVYANNYRGALLEALRDVFERVELWLGSAGFSAAAAAQIKADPPHHWTLNAYGDSFAATLDRLYPDDPEVADLARIDWALRRAFDGPDEPPLDPAMLGTVDWDAALIHPVATLALVPLATNAAAIWTALADEAVAVPPAEPLPAPATLRVWRQGLSPRFTTVADDEALLLDLMRPGASLGALCAALETRLGHPAPATRAGQLLGQWLNDGVIARIAPAGAALSPDH